MKERVLVVDDSQQIRKVVADYVLRPRGFEVLEAESGAQALKLAHMEPLDLIITDLMMPNMSGLEMLEKLQADGRQLPAILMTAYGSEQAAIQALRLGVRDYVIKPFEINEMLESVNRALRETRLERERNQLAQKLMDSTAELQQQMRESHRLYSVQKWIISSLELKSVLRRIVEAAVQISNTEQGVLMLRGVDEQAHTKLFVRAVYTKGAKARLQSSAVTDQLAYQALTQKEPLVVVPETTAAAAVAYIPLQQDAAAPIGVLQVVSGRDSNPFGPHELATLTTLADFSGSAIQNASLYVQSDKARRQLYATLSQTDAPVLLVDEAQRILMVNEQARGALSLSPGEVNGRPVLPLITHAETAAFVETLLQRAEDHQTEFEAADGRVFAIQMNLIQGVGRSLVMSDVTSLKEVTRAQTEFVSTVSHDLRSPLTAIKGYIELLSRTGPLSNTQHRFVGRVQESVSHIDIMITDLLDLGRLESGADLTMLACAVDDMLREILEDLHVQIVDKDQHVQLDFDPDLPPVLGDPLRLRRAFDNLLGNASKYTPAGGEIICRMRHVGDALVIQISDTGIGISPQDQAQIFEKFFRADAVRGSHRGTGLGLSIVQSVIERHGGQIEVDSTLGQGTTFTVTLPVLS